MELKEIMQMQSDFDCKHASTFEWNAPASESDLNVLKYLIIAITGEVGELANTIKKTLRGDIKFQEAQSGIEEECADIFIYLVKFCNQMSLDLEHAFLAKLEKNTQRFQSYEKLHCTKKHETQSPINRAKIIDALDKLTSASEDEIHNSISDYVRCYSHNTDLDKKLQAFLNQHALTSDLPREALLYSLFLSLVLADRAAYESPYELSLLETVRRLCLRQHISFEFIKCLTRFRSELASLLGKCTTPALP